MTFEMETNPVQDVDLLKVMFTHLKFNIALETMPSQKESNLPTIIFQALC